MLEIATKEKPEKQAAALLIADRIVVMQEEDGNLQPQDSEKPEGEPSGKRPKSAAQVELEKLGAQFSYEEGSERYFYTLNWLRRAYELEPKGRTGELAFLLLMERGFDTSPNCASGSEQFREVISRAKEYLRERRRADVEARVHFMMGDSYRDIVALGKDHHGDTYADPSKYKPEAAEARTKAVAEYRAGLALDENSESALIANSDCDLSRLERLRTTGGFIVSSWTEVFRAACLGNRFSWKRPDSGKTITIEIALATMRSRLPAASGLHTLPAPAPVEDSGYFVAPVCPKGRLAGLGELSANSGERKGRWAIPRRPNARQTR